MMQYNIIYYQFRNIMSSLSAPTNSHPKKQQVSDKQNSEDQFIGHYNEAPDFMKDNEHITHGYRIGFNTPKKILKSLFMKHNQIVNIWTHFAPAIIIICVIFYLIWYFSSNQLLSQFQAGKEKLHEGITGYSEALQKYAVVVKMKEMKDFTYHQYEEIQRSLIERYQTFIDSTEVWKENAESILSDLSVSLKNSALSKGHRLQVLKAQFQNVFVPYILNQIIHNIDPERLEKINHKLLEIKNEIDSENFRYVQILHQQTGRETVSRWPIFVFLASALICLLGSALFHLFYPMSGRAYQLFCRLDYAGINLLISGSAFPALYYGMYCTPMLATFYLIFIVTIGLSLFIITLFEYLHRPQNFVLKSCAYGGFGVSLVIPLSHAMINEIVYNNYGDNFSMVASLEEYIAVGISYLGGLYIYTVRCPERHKPGNYNICGHSHQIWHVMVVLGIIFTYMGALQNLAMRRISSCPNQTCSALPF